MINTKKKYFLLAVVVLLTGCFDFTGKPKKPLKKQSEDDLPYLREAVGQESIDLLLNNSKRYSEKLEKK